MRKSIWLLVITTILLQFACADDSRKRKKVEQDVEKAIAPIEQHKQRAFYPIPSPEQMFGFINDNGVSYNVELINSPSNVVNYSDPIKKALNFGIYTADLAYTAAYQDINTTIELYRIVKKLGAEMHIADMMTEEMVEQMQSNMENPDSLALIAGDSYYQAVEYLEKNGQEGKLALMSLGGWIESLHITASAIKYYDPNSKTADRLASQKITFGNLYTYLKKNEGKKGVAEAIKNVQGIRAVFASLEETIGAKTEKSGEGKLVLGKGKKIIMTTEQFDQLKIALEKYRTQLIG